MDFFCVNHIGFYFHLLLWEFMLLSALKLFISLSLSIFVPICQVLHWIAFSQLLYNILSILFNIGLFFLNVLSSPNTHALRRQTQDLVIPLRHWVQQPNISISLTLYAQHLPISFFYLLIVQR